MISKKLIFLICVIFLVPSIFSTNIYNQQGDFSVQIDKLKQKVYNDDINVEYNFVVKNNLNNVQNFRVIIPNQSGWNIVIEERDFLLSSGSQKEFSVKFVANSDFDYSPSIVSPDMIQISQKENYRGFFQFPMAILGENQEVSLRLDVEIDKREKLPVEFEPRISSARLSPISPLGYTITGLNLEEPKNVIVRVQLGNIILSEFEETFSQESNYKVFQADVSSDFYPGIYDAKVIIRKISDDGRSAREWSEERKLEVVKYENLIERESFHKSFFKDTNIIEIRNLGNVEAVYQREVPRGFFSKFFFSSNSEFDKESGKAIFNIELERGETKQLEYSYNYLALYILLLVIIIIVSYIYYRKMSNPLDVETRIYGVKRVEHEGVKSLKTKIGFENIKADEIEELRVVFRMPSYLNIKDGSFLLTEPQHVLKGKNQYKMTWEFKKFEMNDSRIIGFTMVNTRGVLGDIKIPDLEIEVKIGGKIRKYYQSFPIVRG